MDLAPNSCILKRRQVAEKTTEISFSRPSGFTFEAGQYAQIIIPHLAYEDPRGPSRLFSVASSPNDKERLLIAFRDSDSGYKRALTDSPLGFDVIVRGPFGKDFLLPKEGQRPLVFAAGGIGITPFLGLSGFAAETGFLSPITLLYANRSKATTAYLAQLEDIKSKNPRFKVKTKFGALDQQFIKQSVKDVLGAEWYIAGPPGMVEYVKDLLFELGAAQGHIHIEKFTGY